MPQCTFTARAPGRPTVVVTANVDTSAQPYYRLERTAVETGQALVAQPSAVPQAVKGVGLDAYWFPDRTELMATDGKALITVAVSWSSTSQPRQRMLAKLVARAYLEPGQNPASPALFKGYPAPP